VPIPEGLQLLTPWEVIHDTPQVQGHAERLSTELQREIPSTHVLCGIKATAIAHRIDQDDVLFELEGQMLLAVVHLTWSRETDPRWPDTTLFESWEHWVREEMLPAHEDCIYPDNDPAG
jgi:hypothetical protein